MYINYNINMAYFKSNNTITLTITVLIIGILIVSIFNFGHKRYLRELFQSSGDTTTTTARATTTTARATTTTTAPATTTTARATTTTARATTTTARATTTTAPNYSTCQNIDSNINEKKRNFEESLDYVKNRGQYVDDEVPRFLRHLDDCNQHRYIYNLEQAIIDSECKKCNSCDDDNRFLTYKEQRDRSLTSACDEKCNDTPSHTLPENCYGPQSRSGATSRGATSRGATSRGATSSGATSSGATSSGATSSGATSSGATSSGATSSGATSSGATSSGSGSGSMNTTSNNNSGAMAAYGENLDLDDYFDIEKIGESISRNMGEAMTKLGYRRL